MSSPPASRRPTEFQRWGVPLLGGGCLFSLIGAVVGGYLASRAWSREFADAGSSQDGGVYAFFGTPVLYAIYIVSGLGIGLVAGMLIGMLFSTVRAIQRRS